MLGACGAPASPQPPSEQASSERPPPALQSFYDQELAFEGCQPYATTDADAEAFADEKFECARLEVPLDYDDPDGRTAQIALLRVPPASRPPARCCSTPAGPASPG